VSLLEGEPAGAIRPSSGFHPVVRAIWARRLGGEREADRFLAAPLAEIPLPSELPRLDLAADRIELALAAGERLGVFGHDDPDGITSAVLLAEVLEALGGDVESYIPDRHTEGHGLYPALIDRFRESGLDLLVTTDGCSGNRPEVERARGMGLDVLVTDHHEIAAGRPAPDLLVNPKADPAVARTRGDLTGAGVAALLAHELLARASRPDLVPVGLDLVALGTIADWGDLGNSNRVMVARGLDAVAAGERPAIAAARDALGLDAGDVLRPESCRRLAGVFASVPSVEGRSIGFDALVGRPGWEEGVAALLERWTAAEREVREVVERAEKEARRAGILDGAPAVLVLEGVPTRALGSAATRLVELTSRAAAVLRPGPDGVVSELRGPEGVHLVDVLAGMSDLLASWGGHRVAAGFSADPDRLEAVRARLVAALERERPDPPEPVVADAEAEPGELDAAFPASIRAAAPFGKGNPVPLIRLRRPARVSSELAGEALAAALQESPGCAILLAGRLPDGSRGRDPLLSFRPLGDSSVEARFEGWAETPPETTREKTR
jgi:single-stranded-DNA-specific exonuclease